MMRLEFRCRCGALLSREVSDGYDSRAIMNGEGWAIIKGGGYGCADCIASGQVARDPVAMNDDMGKKKRRVFDEAD
ncbi:MAG: hypothetical protein WC374_11280 [Phycisphaerae bacterium]|jgi:hypothetical protein